MFIEVIWELWMRIEPLRNSDQYHAKISIANGTWNFKKQRIFDLQKLELSRSVVQKRKILKLTLDIISTLLGRMFNLMKVVRYAIYKLRFSSNLQF